MRIETYGGVAEGNSILGNPIGANTLLGIDIGDFGVTPNDLDDSDEGPNRLQNFPVLASAASNGAATIIKGSLNSLPEADFRLEFFFASTCDPSGNGEGEIFLGAGEVHTDAEGDVDFAFELPVPSRPGGFVTASATDATGNTSELSACVPVAQVPLYVWHYEYDPLQRLTYACSLWDESTGTCEGSFFRYAYDAVGNRLSEEAEEGTTFYTYDAANRLTSVDGVAYTWSDNGNLLSDGVDEYAYGHANRLIHAVHGFDDYNFEYNGLGDRLEMTINTGTTRFTLDLAAGLTQVLADGEIAYLYGVGRIGEEQTGGWQYHLYDALGSLRQLSNLSPSVTLGQTYEPFGEPFSAAGGDGTIFDFAGEQRDGTRLMYLRARYYAPWMGRFIGRDMWETDPLLPTTLNRWAYAGSNPVSRVDPTGQHCVGSGCPAARLPEHRVDGSSSIAWRIISAPCGTQPIPLPQSAPPSRGYVEGAAKIMSLVSGTGSISGRDVVYDFATMTRLVFAYSGIIWGLTQSGEGAIYVGYLDGFTFDPEIPALTNALIVDDYAGWARGSFVSLSAANILGVGANFFHSEDSNVWGYEIYMSLGLSLPMEGGRYRTLAAQAAGEGIWDYADQYGEVDRAGLALAILAGDRSPIPGGTFPDFLSIIGSARVSAVGTMLTEARKYEGIMRDRWGW